jgi:hypothetical protein
MWLLNELKISKVQAYNEKDIVRGDGGLVEIDVNDTVELRITIIPMYNRFRQTDMGRFNEMPLHFQISKSELSKKDFTLILGKTHIIKDGSIYRLTQIQDASYVSTKQLYDCLAIRKIPVESAV